MSFSWEEAVLIQNTLMERKSEEGKCVSEKERERERDGRNTHTEMKGKRENQIEKYMHTQTYTQRQVIDNSREKEDVSSPLLCSALPPLTTLTSAS